MNDRSCASTLRRQFPVSRFVARSRTRTWLLLSTFLALQGCYSIRVPVTYLSPVATEGDRIVYPPPNNRGYGFSGFQSLCPAIVMPVDAQPTRVAVAFEISGVQLCFRSPGHTQKCAAGALDHAPKGGSLIFQVLVLGRDLDLSNVRGLLEVNGRTSSALPDVTNSLIGASAHDPDAQLGSPDPQGRLYTLPRKELSFRFDQPCDLQAHYALSVEGMRSNGTLLEFAPVRFEPRKEWRPVPFD
jgi:hypothetical protein